MRITFVIPVLFFLLGCANDGSTKGYFTGGRKHAVGTSQILEQPTDSLIALLPAMKSNSLDCNADAYWQIISRGRASIPLLIESLTDTTTTNIYNHCKNGKLNVGDISYFALEEIAEFPAFLVTHKQFDLLYGDGCWTFYDYLFNNTHKKEYQKMARDFYNANEYIFTKFDKQELNRRGLNKCRNQYNITGKLKLKRKE